MEQNYNGARQRRNRLEVYEWASLFMLSILFIVFVVFARKIHTITGVHLGAPALLSNVIAIAIHGTTWFYAGLSVGLWLVIRFTRNKQNDEMARRLHGYARVALTFVAVLIFFDTINFYIAVFNPYDHDALLRHIDKTIFGATPAVWFDPITCLPLTLLFCGAYASWFVMTYFSVFIFSTHSERAMHEYVTAAVLAFYIGYVTYFFVPAIGPVFTVHFTHSIGPLINLVDGKGPFLSRDCFPSLHTGLSVVMLIHAWRYKRKWFWFYALDCGLIITSTLYLRVHYGIDLIAGAALAMMVCQLAPVLVSRHSIENRPFYYAGESSNQWSEFA